ncbi:AsnC family protein, partial [Polaromonas sp.]|uniref:AsnC family protein n=1 Tax=Polaromonas sp. TaxID=1869339 RepID=UPI00286B474D
MKNSNKLNIRGEPGGFPAQTAMFRGITVNFPLNFAFSPDNSLAMFEPSPDIDRIDLKILNVLQQDGRISNLKLAD